MKHPIIFLLLGLALLPFCPQAEARLASIKAQGLGGASIAYPQDSLVGAYNPAAMVCVGTRADFGLYMSIIDPVTTVSATSVPAGNGVFSGAHGNHLYSGEYGFNWMVCDSTDVSIGLCIYTLDHWRASYSASFPAFGTTPLKMDLWQGVIAPMFALRFERFAVGMSFDFIGQRFEANGFENFDNIFLSAQPGYVTNHGAEFAEQFTFTIGALYLLNRCWTLGASYQPRSFKGGRFNRYRGLIPRGGRIRTPRRLTAGLWYHPSSAFSVAIDVEHRWWKDSHFFNNDMPINNLALIGSPFGSSGGPGLSWHDQFLFHFGMDWKYSDAFTFRVGYRFGQGVVDNDKTFLNSWLVPTVEQWFSFGTTWESGCYQVSGFYSYGVKREITGKAGDVHPDYGGGIYTLCNKEHIVGIGIGWGWRP